MYICVHNLFISVRVIIFQKIFLKLEIGENVEVLSTKKCIVQPNCNIFLKKIFEKSWKKISVSNWLKSYLLN